MIQLKQARGLILQVVQRSQSLCLQQCTHVNNCKCFLYIYIYTISYIHMCMYTLYLYLYIMYFTYIHTYNCIRIHNHIFTCKDACATYTPEHEQTRASTKVPQLCPVVDDRGLASLPLCNVAADPRSSQEEER